MDSLPIEVLDHIVSILSFNEPAHTWIELRHTSSGFKRAVERVFATVFVPDLRLQIRIIDDHAKRKPHMTPLLVNLHNWRDDCVLAYADAPHAALAADHVAFGPRLRTINGAAGLRCDTLRPCICGGAALNPAAPLNPSSHYIVPPRDCPLATQHIVVPGWAQAQKLPETPHHLVVKVTTAGDAGDNNSEREHAIVELIKARLPLVHTGAALTLAVPWKQLLTLLLRRAREQQRLHAALGLDRPAHRSAEYDHDAAGRLVLKPALQSLYIEPEPTECYCAARTSAMRAHVRAANQYVLSCAWAAGSVARRTALRRDAARALRGRFFPPGLLAWEDLVRCKWCGAPGRAQLLLALSPGFASGAEYRHLAGPWSRPSPERAVVRARQAPVWRERGELGMVVPRRNMFLGVVHHDDPLKWKLSFWPAWVRECRAVGRDRKWFLQE